ncbi:hypothetical protein [Saccharolobus caldissimus]|nr:hypothetical protein [Saccharolobus caldissimus]
MEEAAKFVRTRKDKLVRKSIDTILMIKKHLGLKIGEVKELA